MTIVERRALYFQGANPNCPRYKAFKVDVMHAFKDCPIWREALTFCSIYNDLLCMSFYNAIDWLGAAMWKTKKLSLGWNSSPQDVFLKAQSIHHDFRVHDLFYLLLAVPFFVTMGEMVLVDFACSIAEAFDAPSIKVLALACASQKAL
ncbi:hypothetical protein Golob_002221 [Gossypium lobatum]|uniref:Reverse transcriptase zinc-binding domain-containing protein n=1 Tax=Gossypium lobatum TaxID=34289 RepID=A0A7J8N4G8_9ROSI|nr:hypothetical protein [Gossypium lobatum]